MEGGDDFFDRGFEVGLTDSYNGRSDALYRAPIRGPGPIYGRYKGDTMYQIPIHVLRQQPQREAPPRRTRCPVVPRNGM